MALSLGLGLGLSRRGWGCRHWQFAHVSPSSPATSPTWSAASRKRMAERLYADAPSPYIFQYSPNGGGSVGSGGVPAFAKVLVQASEPLRYPSRTLTFDANVSRRYPTPRRFLRRTPATGLSSCRVVLGQLNLS